MKKYTGYIATGLVCAGVTFGACWFTMDYNRRDTIELGEKLLAAKECEDILRENDYPLADNDTAAGAISGYVSAIANDKYTYYYEDDDDITYMVKYVNTAGTAIASGFQIDISDDGNILLTEIVPSLAADNQGLRTGDVITAINGDSVSETGFENIANKMLGKEGTEVTFTVRRDGKEFDLDFVRSNVYLNEVTYEIVGDVGIIDIDSFSQLGKGQLDQAIIGTEKCDKLIIDLRNDPGGDIAAAVDMGAEIAGHCECTLDYFTGEKKVYDVSLRGRCNDKKIIVLINEKTASSAEILTASLIDELGVTTVGVTTRGKGIFQEEADLSNGGHLHYTVGKFTVGNRENWQDIGISPDIEVEMDSILVGTDLDIQLQKALELLN